MNRQGLVPRPRGGVRQDLGMPVAQDLGMPVAQDSWFGKAEGGSGTGECMGQVEARDDLQLLRSSLECSQAVAELALGGDLILM